MTFNLVKGDLCTFSGYQGRLYPGIFLKDTGHSLQFMRLNSCTVEDLKKGVKPSVDYISGSIMHERVAKISEDALDPTELAYYKEIKAL